LQAWYCFIVAAVLALTGIQRTQQAIAATSNYVWDVKIAAIGNTLAMGNFFVGVSLGLIAATIVWLVIFAVIGRQDSHD
jgi:hypothetical protein